MEFVKHRITWNPINQIKGVRVVAFLQILSKKPNRVTEEKMKKLVDDYVEFYRRNPL